MQKTCPVRDVASVATHCSLFSVRPLAGRPHAVWLTHSHPVAVHGMLRCPFVFAPFPPSRTLCASPLAGGSAGVARAPWLGSAAHAAVALPSA